MQKNLPSLYPKGIMDANVCIRFEKGAGNVPGNVPSLKDYIFTGLQV